MTLEALETPRDRLGLTFREHNAIVDKLRTRIEELEEVLTEVFDVSWQPEHRRLMEKVDHVLSKS